MACFNASTKGQYQTAEHACIQHIHDVADGSPVVIMLDGPSLWQKKLQFNRKHTLNGYACQALKTAAESESHGESETEF